jgi:hypothetical protein
MKLLSTIALVMLVMLNIQAQELFPVQNAEKKWGYQDASKKMVIDYKFDYAFKFSEGLAGVQIDKLFGFIDTKGNVVINPEYEKVFSFSGGSAEVVKGGLFGLIDKKGKVLGEIKYVGNMFWGLQFTDGLAKVNSNKLYGIINRMGREILPVEYSYISDFKYGFAQVEKDKKAGIINRNGDFIVPLIYDNLVVLNEVNFGFKSKGLWGMLNQTGKEIIPANYKNIDAFSEGLAAVQNNDDLWGYIDITNKLVIPYKHSWAQRFSEGFAAVHSPDYLEDPEEYWADRAFYIDKTGKIVSDFYDDAQPFKNGLAIVVPDDETGYKSIINKQFKELNEQPIENIKPFIDGIAIVEGYAGWNYIDSNIKFLSKENFLEANEFSEGLAHVQSFKNKLFGYIDKTGTVVIPFQYKSATKFDKGFAIVTDAQDKKIFINKQGVEVKK